MTATAKTAPAEALAIGNKAPDFSMVTDDGSTVSLATLAGKNTVLYFYPKDDTPGCTVEAKDFRDHIEQFKKHDGIVIGVSRDSVKSHVNFKEKYCLPFPLASDENGAACENYGVWVEKSMYGKTYMGIERTTVLIDKKGIIRQIWHKVKVEGHVAQVLEALAAL
jgi:peroxiredoxin Q/BCP